MPSIQTRFSCLRTNKAHVPWGLNGLPIPNNNVSPSVSIPELSLLVQQSASGCLKMNLCNRVNRLWRSIYWQACLFEGSICWRDYMLRIGIWNQCMVSVKPVISVFRSPWCTSQLWCLSVEVRVQVLHVLGVSTRERRRKLTWHRL